MHLALIAAGARPVTADSVFTAKSKQVLRRGAHFADARDEQAAAQIALALNLVLETPADQPLTAPRAAEPKPDEGEDHE